MADLHQSTAPTTADAADARFDGHHTGATPASASTEPVVPQSWISPKLQRWLRYSPRLGRLVTTIDLFAPELTALQERMSPASGSRDQSWRELADQNLINARAATNQRRIDDGWHFLHSAQQQALHGLTAAEVAAEVAAMKRECAAKLEGWRQAAAEASVATVEQAMSKANDMAPGGAPEVAYVALVKGRRLLDDNSHNTYLRLRLVGQRLVLATALLVVVLVGLGAAVSADALGSQQFPAVTALHDVGTYVTTGLLGILGALLSFSLGALRSGTRRRIYELASGRYVSTVARVLVGGTAAITVAIAVQSGVVALQTEWLPIIAVAAGFSERLVRRIVESLSADAEKPSDSRPARHRPADGEQT